MENHFKCQVNWSSKDGFLLNTYSDSPEEAMKLMGQLKGLMAQPVEADRDEKELVDAIDNTSDPICPKCQSLMVKRYSKKNKRYFYGCTNYPQCDGTKDIIEND